jgi:dTDP-4-amino-4,6-dideoxygalactose transaminase
MDFILQLCEQYQIPLIEDAAEALGSTYLNKSDGCWGKAGILSFNGNKMMTCGGGIMLLTDDALQAEQARIFPYRPESSTA